MPTMTHPIIPSLSDREGRHGVWSSVRRFDVVFSSPSLQGREGDREGELGVKGWGGFIKEIPRNKTFWLTAYSLQLIAYNLQLIKLLR